MLILFQILFKTTLDTSSLLQFILFNNFSQQVPSVPAFRILPSWIILEWQDAACTTCRSKLVNIRIFARAFTLWRGHPTCINNHQHGKIRHGRIHLGDDIGDRNFLRKKLCILRSQIRSAAIIEYLSQMKAFNEDKTRCQL